MLITRILLTGLLAGGVLESAGAQAPDDVPTVRDPDLEAGSQQEDEELEPEVRIIERGQGRVEEYRRGGALYMIKVVPARGFPYYLVDSDGDGQLDTRRNDLDPDVVIPRWTLFRFD